MAGRLPLGQDIFSPVFRVVFTLVIHGMIVQLGSPCLSWPDPLPFIARLTMMVETWAFFSLCGTTEDWGFWGFKCFSLIETWGLDAGNPVQATVCRKFSQMTVPFGQSCDTVRTPRWDRRLRIALPQALESVTLLTQSRSPRLVTAGRTRLCWTEVTCSQKQCGVVA